MDIGYKDQQSTRDYKDYNNTTSSSNAHATSHGTSGGYYNNTNTHNTTNKGQVISYSIYYTTVYNLLL